jgi:RNA polymerase sigma-70 factor (ECF subfamily)
LKNRLTEQDEAENSDFIDIYARLLSIARSIGHRDSAAEDRVQEACVRLLEAGNSGEIRNKENYCRRILRNLKIDGARLSARAASLPVDEMLIDPHPGPERAAQARQELDRVARAIEGLPPRCRLAFELHRFGNLSYAEIAQRMGISISMVEKHIAEAIFRLASALER